MGQAVVAAGDATRRSSSDRPLETLVPVPLNRPDYGSTRQLWQKTTGNACQSFNKM
jgi:hypothetical protein